jgi:hypothetical protein
MYAAVTRAIKRLTERRCTDRMFTVRAADTKNGPGKVLVKSQTCMDFVWDGAPPSPLPCPHAVFRSRVACIAIAFLNKVPTVCLTAPKGSVRRTSITMIDKDPRRVQVPSALPRAPLG